MRARFNRVSVRRALASFPTTAMLAWRCESCRQTTLVGGLVPRSARRGFGAPLSFDGDKRGRMRQFYEAVILDQNFLWSDVSLKKFVLNLAGMTFQLEQDLKNKIGSVILEEIAVIYWSENPSTGREQKSASVDKSCRSRHVTRLWCSSTTTSCGVERHSCPTRTVNSTSWRASHFRLTRQSW